MDLFDQVAAAAQGVSQRSKLKPRVGIVLGSGLGAFTQELGSALAIPYGELPHFPVSSVTGHAGELVLGTLGGTPCAALSGRVHYYEGYDLERVGFPMRVLARLGVGTLIITNAAGAVNESFVPGDIMLITDHLNLTGANPLRGLNDERLGPRFPDMSDAYWRDGRRLVHQSAARVGVSLREGVYAGLAGPSYETPAEIRMLRTLGADAVGMSTVAEVIVAAHAGVRVLGLSIITNRAAGLSSTPLSHDEVKAVGLAVQGVLCDLLRSVVEFLP